MLLEAKASVSAQGPPMATSTQSRMPPWHPASQGWVLLGSCPFTCLCSLPEGLRGAAGREKRQDLTLGVLRGRGSVMTACFCANTTGPSCHQSCPAVQELAEVVVSAEAHSLRLLGTASLASALSLG